MRLATFTHEHMIRLMKENLNLNTLFIIVVGVMVMNSCTKVVEIRATQDEMVRVVGSLDAKVTGMEKDIVSLKEREGIHDVRLDLLEHKR